MQSYIYWIGFLFVGLVSCDKKEQSTPPLVHEKVHPAADGKRLEPITTEVSTKHGVALLTERLPAHFEFKVLLDSVGQDLQQVALNRIETEGQNLPEFKDVLCKGGIAYTVGLQNEGGLLVFISDKCQVAFGYAYHSPPSNSNPEESHLFNEFELKSETMAKALNSSFDEVTFPVRWYEHKKKKNLQAIDFTHNANRSVVFFDASKADTSKLLPASPEQVGSDTIKQMKELLEQAKQVPDPK
jgi:hypothetical protein